MLALAGFGGVILGLGLGVLRDISDRVFRSPGQVEERLKADCISIVPLHQKRTQTEGGAGA